ncbi:zinc-dependent alcohol dehydrogenase [Scopulibacillus cellulosilyticus]|uniref:Zinc-binding dehydrogenase n=1 Tax=Scopulibacillus cellulosilyticus TaxID=2665665 RepID=A0ABW2PV70_9BACL
MLELRLNKPRDLSLKDSEPVQHLLDHEVKIELIYGGICGSDLSVFKGKLGHASYPVRPGHELLGTIIATGKDVNYEIGTRVVVAPNTFCDECDFCSAGKPNICRNKKSIGVNADGGFAEEIIVSSKYVLPIPEDISNEKAILIEPLSVIVHALRKVHITKDCHIAIMGCGTEGMLTAAMACYLGARITAIDINPLKLDIVKRLGDIRAVNPNEIENETFDIVIEAAGAKASVEQAVQLVKPGGTMVLIGMTPEANLPISHIVRNEISLLGSIIYNFPSDFSKSLQYLREEKLDLQPVISKIVPIKNYQEAYEMALSGNYGKVILDFRKG